MISNMSFVKINALLKQGFAIEVHCCFSFFPHYDYPFIRLTTIHISPILSGVFFEIIGD